MNSERWEFISYPEKRTLPVGDEFKFECELSRNGLILFYIYGHHNQPVNKMNRRPIQRSKSILKLM